MLRPRTCISRVVAAFSRVLERCDEEGVQLILLSGANPSAQLPLSRVIQRRGDLLSHAVGRADRRSPRRRPRVQLARPRALDRRLLVGGPAPHELPRPPPRRGARAHGARHGAAADWWSLPPLPRAARGERSRTTASTSGPWVRRRLTGTSSGDGREPKYAGVSADDASRSARADVAAAPSRPARRTARPAAPTPASSRSDSRRRGRSGLPEPSVTGATETRISSRRPASANWPTRSPPPTSQTSPSPAASRISAQIARRHRGGSGCRRPATSGSAREDSTKLTTSPSRTTSRDARARSLVLDDPLVGRRAHDERADALEEAREVALRRSAPGHGEQPRERVVVVGEEAVEGGGGVEDDARHGATVSRSADSLTRIQPLGIVLIG